MFESQIILPMENPLHHTYTPKYFCRDLMEIKGNGLQLGIYMALILGLKPLLDDWIPVERLREFKKTCQQYGIHAREDVVFDNLPKEEIPLNVLGRECLTTTSAYGRPLDSGKVGEVHVFLSKDKRLLKKAMWYPVIVKDRVVFAPRIDHLKYGYVLGYPDCCIKFFRKFNDWLKFSHLYEIYKNTHGAPAFPCNPFLKDTIFSYIYHMPCSYRCPRTMGIVQKLRRGIARREPGYLKITDAYLKKPLLVLYERKFYIFDGALKDNLLSYKDVHFLGRDVTKDVYGLEFKKADALKLVGRTIALYRRNKVFKRLHIPMAGFAPEFPFLVQFH